MHNEFSTKEKRILFGIAVLLTVYMFMRAALVPLIGDEGGTYFFYIQTHDYIPYQAHWDANNHLVNSALSSFFITLFGTAAWAVRLANVVFLPLYLFSTYRISKLLTTKYLQWGFVLTCWFAQFFIEFFGFCRGYGMSMALLVTALYYLCRFTQQQSIRYLVFMLIFTSLGQLANMSLLNCFLLINGWAFLVCVIHFKAINKIKAALSFLLLSGLPFVFFITYLFELKQRGLLYYGSDKGFYEVTLKTVSLLIVGSDALPVILAIIAVFAAALAAFIFIKLKDKKIAALDSLFVYMLTGSIAIIMLLGTVLKINYPEDRVGMYLFPLLVCMVFFVADTIQKPLFKYALALPFLFFPLQFPFIANTTYSRLWYEDHIPERYFDTVLKDPGTNGFPPIVSGYKMRTMVWAYYNQQKHQHQNQVQENDFWTNLLSDYIITRRGDVNGWGQYYNEIDFDPVSSLALLKRKQPLKQHLLYTSPDINIENTTGEFHNFLELIQPDSLAGRNLRVEVEGVVKVHPDSLPDGQIVIAQTDILNNIIAKHYTQIDWLSGKQPNGEYPFKYSYALQASNHSLHRFVVFYWNIDRRNISLTKGKLRLYELAE